MKKIFELSPVEERRKVTGKIGALWDLGGDHHKEADRYIAVLAYRNTLIVSAIVGMAVMGFSLYLAHRLGADFRSLNYLGFDSLATDVGFVGFYAYIHASLMGYVVFLSAPVYFLLFLFNVKKGDVDLFRFDAVLKHKENRTRKKKIKRFFLFLAAFPLAYIMSFWSYAALSHVVRWAPQSDAGETYAFLLFYYALSVVGHASAAVVLYLGVIMAYGLTVGFDMYEKKKQ